MIDTFITQFDDEYRVLNNIQAEKIDISDNNWLAYKFKLYNNNQSEKKETCVLKSNFNY